MVIDPGSSKKKARKVRRKRSYAEKVEYFWSQVSKTDDRGCWVFEGTRLARGYGQFYGDARHRLAHQFSWKIEHGDVPRGQNVCHTCDNPPCVRPSHLFLGSQSDNMRDASAKGRLPTGADHHMVKDRLRLSTSYTAEEDRLIVENYGRVSVEELGKIVGRPWKAVFERVRRLGLKPPERRCPVCQTDFTPRYLANQLTCSKRCKHRYDYQKLKERGGA